MNVDLNDGRCRTCGGQLRITDADDATMTVECTSPDCADQYDVEPDAFHDGAMEYYPAVMARKMRGGRDE